MPHAAADLVHLLAPLVSGLLVMSEMDAPLQAQVLPGATLTEAVAPLAAGYTGIEPQPEWDVLLTRQAVVYDYHTAEQRAEKARFDRLREWVAANLSDVQALKLGEVRRLYVLGGRAADGQWVVLTCELVET